MIPLFGKFSFSSYDTWSFRESDYVRALENILIEINGISSIIEQTPDRMRKYHRKLVLAIICWYISDVESPLGMEEVNEKAITYQKLADLYLSSIGDKYRKLIGELDLTSGKIPSELKDVMRNLTKGVKNLSSRQEIAGQLYLLDMLEQMTSSRRIKIVLKKDEDYKNLREAILNRYRAIND